ncbi:DNA polymerase [Flavivirga abyssicola]|uniref:DNA polymerase n=1 Tax=Flavivirga abyssicola TaxID=3063533 RepID=UPI0026DEE4D4|nr:DNA polymerase [Flavivirga sp. MEBiC07777]WVK14039.1 DNA polymerase [Flavivirga sp. MEBiC07777]
MRKLVYDLETTSLNVHKAIILGIAICFGVGVAVYIAFPNDSKKVEQILSELKPFFEDETIEKVGHNLKYDNQVLKRYGINVKGRLHDTMVMSYVTAPNRESHGLKHLSKVLLNYQQIEFDDIAVGKTKKSKTLEGIDPNIVKNYACEDVDQTLQVFNNLLPQIKDNSLSKVYDLDCDLVPTITDMEFTGVKIDSDKLSVIESEIDTELSIIKASIDQIVGGEINLNSQPQLNKLLFDKFNLEPIGDKGISGYWSVSASVLKRLLPQHSIIKPILDYKGLIKVKTTFIKALKKVNPVTGRLHASINQCITETGRLSCSKPNLQNIPSRTVGKRLRECFVASGDNHTLIGVDYSNIELRIMAIISQDPIMVNAYRNKEDLHTLTASKALQIDRSMVDKQLRNVGKLINFGLIYGMTAKGLQQSLYQNAGKEYSIEQCQSFINSYFELYQGVAKCREELIYKATVNGYTETLFGRKRPLQHINSNDSFKREGAKRLALNTPIQGSASDIIKMAMVNIHNRITKEGLQSKMLLQVHDELLFDVPNNELKYMETLIKYEMENAVHLPIALEVDLQTGETWADVH